MNYDNTTNELPEFNNEGKLPSLLNVLTILTFIGSGLGLLGAFMLPMSCKMMDKMEESALMPAAQLEQMSKLCSNITLIMIGAILGAALCLAGAVLMRKLKSSGFLLYIVGTFLPLVLNLILVGSGYLTNGWQALLGLAMSLLFPILYFTQKKYLVK